MVLGVVAQAELKIEEASPLQLPTTELTASIAQLPASELPEVCYNPISLDIRPVFSLLEILRLQNCLIENYLIGKSFSWKMLIPKILFFEERPDY